MDIYKTGLGPVLKSGLCVGCGICAGLFPKCLKMEVMEYGEYRPILRKGCDDRDLADVAEICPFCETGDNEDALGQREFSAEPQIQNSSELGYFLSTYVAWVTNDEERWKSSAGGVTTWLLKYLLKNRLIDGAVCVVPTFPDKSFFRYTIVRYPEQLDLCRKSKYYPVELSQVLEELVSTSGRFAVVGLPCFIKGLKLAIKAGRIPQQRIFYTLGLFCGHLKTRQFARYLIRCCGFQEDKVVNIDFRKKIDQVKASDYAFEAVSRSKFGAFQKRSVRMKDILLGNWGLNAFMLKACECCDDVVTELADISLGDAWLPEYVEDSRGTNLVICRRPELREILNQGVMDGNLGIRPVEPDAIVRAQEGAFRQRRSGLAYRLYLAEKKGEWRPPKRVAPDRNSIRLYSKAIQKIRMKIDELSKVAFLEHEQNPTLLTFNLRMKTWVYLYNTFYSIRKKISSMLR